MDIKNEEYRPVMVFDADENDMESLDVFPIALNDIELENLRNDCAQIILDLIINAESEIYSSLIKLDKFEILLNNDETIRNIILIVQEDQFNKLYNNMAKSDDYHFWDVIENLHKHKKHCTLCILNTLAKLTLDTHIVLDRHNFNINEQLDIDPYLESVKNEINKILPRLNISNSFNFDCEKANHSYDIYELPYQQKQFNFKFKIKN
jgi:hypothetical protein